jgi:hypothetical protein
LIGDVLVHATPIDEFVERETDGHVGRLEHDVRVFGFRSESAHLRVRHGVQHMPVKRNHPDTTKPAWLSEIGSTVRASKAHTGLEHPCNSPHFTEVSAPKDHRLPVRSTH